MSLSKVYLQCTKKLILTKSAVSCGFGHVYCGFGHEEIVDGKVHFFFTEKMKKDIAAHQHDQSIDIRQKSGRITCQFRGDGTYHVLWNRVNNTKLREGIIENKTTLIFNDVQFNDTGTYQCTAIGPKNTATAKIDLEVYGKLFYYSCIFC